MDIAIVILEHLATYSFLTKSQLHYLGVSVSDKTFYQNLKRLREPSSRFIQSRKFPPHPKWGALEDMHYLLPKGRKYLMQQHKRQPGNIARPMGASRFTIDYNHRMKTIWLHILLKKYFEEMGASILSYVNYFNRIPKKLGKGRESGTKIPLDHGYLKADALCLIQKDNKKYLYCIELHNGHDVSRIFEQLKQYGKALALGSPSDKIGLAIPCKVLTVFEHESTMSTTLERLKSDVFFTHLKAYYVYKPFQKLFTCPGQEWLDYTNIPHSLL